MSEKESNERPKKKPGIIASAMIAFCVIVPTVTIGYVIDNCVQDFLITVLVIIPIMGICLGIYARFSKIRLTFIEVLVLMSIAALLLSIILPAGLHCDKTSTAPCQYNIRQLYILLMQYAYDHENQWPSENSWCDLLIKENENSKDFFRCKGDKQGPHSYAFNKNILKFKPEEIPANLVVLFESVSGSNNVGGPDLLTTKNHRVRGCTIVFGDGHTEFVRTSEFDELNWGDKHLGYKNGFLPSQE